MDFQSFSDTDDVSHLKVLFTWAGMFRMLELCTVDDFMGTLETFQKILLECYYHSKKYAGQNPQVISGYEEMNNMIETFVTFYPNLKQDLENSLK
jgi:hypothetical protein